MGKEKLKIYICSNVGIDYFFFLGKTLTNVGYTVIPIFLISESSYREMAKSKGLNKIWLRIKMYVFYPLYLMIKVLGSRKGSIYIVTSNTFYAPYLTKFVARIRAIKVIHLLYDLFPDALEIAGAIKSNGTLSMIIGSITKGNLCSCDGTVFLGDFLKEHAENRWGRPHLGKTIDIASDISSFSNDFNEYPPSTKVMIHYGGQLGHLHDANSIIESIKCIRNSDISEFIDFNFYVSGAQAEFLERSLKNYNVSIRSAVPSSQWREDIKKFHIGLVSLSPGGASVCLPSKTYGMMAGGMAIMAICPEWSDLARMLKRMDSGWVINNSAFNDLLSLQSEDYLSKLTKFREIEDITQNFYNVLKNLVSNPEQVSEKRRNAYFKTREHFNINMLGEKWDTFLKDVYQN